MDERFEETQIRFGVGACFLGHLRHWVEFCFGSEDSGFATTSQRRHGAPAHANACASHKSNRQPAGNNSNANSHTATHTETDASPNARCHVHSD